MTPLARLTLLAALAGLCSAAIAPRPCALAAATGGGYTFSLTLCPATLAGGSESWGNQVLLDVPPGADPGINLALLSDNAAATVAPVVNVPGGSTTQIFHIQTSPVAVETQVHITVIYAGVSASAILTLTPPAASCATDVSSAVMVRRSGYLYSRVTRRFVQKVTLTNSGSNPLAGPLSLVVAGLSANATLHAPSGVTACLPPAGSPYDEVLPSGTLLAPGAFRTVILEFLNPTMQPITYSSVVASGSSR